MATLGNITFYADDPRRLSHFWAGPKDARNRIHLDVNAPRADGQDDRAALEAEKDRLVALGASVVRLVDQQWGPWPELYFQMRDPEGNEFCLQ